MERLSDSVRGELSRFGPQAGVAEIVERWPEAVGAAIARNAWPARLGRDGTLHVTTADSVWAFELAHRASEIAARLGVEAVRFAPGHLPSAELEPAPLPQLEPTPSQLRSAAAIAGVVSDENLREQLEKAVGLSLARASSDRPL